MKMSQMFPSNYLGQDDVMSPFVTTIIKITRDELKNDNGNEVKTVLHFANIEKAFICNKTNAFTLVDAYGDDSDHWIGKAVEVYVDPNVTYGGKRVGGVRLRIPTGGRLPAQSSVGAHVNGFLTFDQAVAECNKVNISKDQLIAHMKGLGLKGYIPNRDTPTVRGMIASVSQPEQSFDDGPHQTDDEIPFG